MITWAHIYSMQNLMPFGELGKDHIQGTNNYCMHAMSFLMSSHSIVPVVNHGCETDARFRVITAFPEKCTFIG